jgi:homoserine kinase
LLLVVATPDLPLETAKARAVLPAQVPMADAIFNVQRSVRLVRALETRDYSRLREALADRLHQPHRAPLVPGLADALALDDPAVLGACLSGAGPSIAALARREGAEHAAALLRNIYDRLRIGVTVRILNAETPTETP